MKNRLAIFLLLAAVLMLPACAVWREHPGSSKWTDATGGEGLERSFWKEVKAKIRTRRLHAKTTSETSESLLTTPLGMEDPCSDDDCLL